MLMFSMFSAKIVQVKLEYRMALARTFYVLKRLNSLTF